MTPKGRGVLTPFTLATMPDASPAVRGRLCNLDGPVSEILARHDYPDSVAGVVAQSCVLASLLASGLKYEGAFTLQTQGDGPVSRIVADMDSAGALRACATYDEERLNALLGKRDRLPTAALTGVGHLAFTVDQGPDTERYQGIVELSRGGLKDSVYSYFRQSEQIPTGLRVLVVRDQVSGNWIARGLMVQRMPAEGGFRPMERDPAPTPEADDLWETTGVFLGSLTDEELADESLSHDELLYRLFNEVNPRTLPERPVHFGCRCSREKLAATLASFPYAELAQVADPEGTLDVTCEFCRETYAFALTEFSAE